ncbi:hypothetical protein NQ314_006369 [Rhamnusium bicolor]|uniref:Uncharacterized protein n=1 Tax=Rhamnusium bicolor TaxID=1586634 RepID=A0AAV8Z6H4_9CUCU|nr:hypothetical protein NQ314_006369 [Rhamnusium bicolor]
MRERNHIPKAKATTMAETPELKRIAENTKLQSNVKYHADFEKSKGKFTQVADDPETLRIKQNTKIISNVAYHGDLLRKAEMEQRRHVNENANGFKEPDQKNANVTQNTYQPPPPPIPTSQVPTINQPPQAPIGNPSNIGKISDYDPQVGTQFQSPYSSRTSQTLIYSSDVGTVNNPPQRHIGL